MRVAGRLAAGLMLLASAACGSKGAVAISASVDSTSAVVSSGVLQRVLGGGFTLHLALGSYAPTGTDVSVQKTSLIAADGQTSVVDSLKTDGSPKPPYHVEPGGATDVVFTITDGTSAGGQSLTQAELDAICAARTVQILMALTDTASGQPTPAGSLGFDVAGCP